MEGVRLMVRGVWKKIAEKMSEWECGCPVCCALVRTVRACPFQLPFKCVCLCLSDGQSKHPWVGVVCASLSRCSALQWVT